MNLSLIIAISCWIIFGLYWIINSFSQKPRSEKPISTETIIARILFIVAWIILIKPEWFYSSQILFANNLIIEIISAILCIAGLIICIWARKTIAGNWSSNIDFKKNHELVQSGPYNLVRHPIYTGFLLMFLGLALAIGEFGGLIGFVILFIGVLLRIREEEKLMTKHFKEKYSKYKKRVKSALVPYLY